MSEREILVAGSALIAAFQLTAAAIIARKNATGWIISMTTCILAVPYDAVTAQYGFIVTSAVSFAIAARAWRTWRTQEAGT